MAFLLIIDYIRRYMIIRKNRVLLLLLLSLFGFQTTSLSAYHKKETTNILFLHSYGKDFFSDEVMRGALEELDGSGHIEVFVDYLDTRLISSPEYYEVMKKIYNEKYGDYSFDVVITTNNNALSFAFSNREFLFPDAFILFSGWVKYSRDMIVWNPHIDGVQSDIDFSGTIQIALRLLPDAEKAYVLVDDSWTGRLDLDVFLSSWHALNPSEANIPELVILNDKSTDDLLKILSEANAGDVAFFLTLDNDVHHHAVSNYALNQILMNSNIPVFGWREELVGQGLVGGHCLSGYLQGKAVGTMARTYLETGSTQGGDASSSDTSHYIFDMGMLNKYNLSRQDLPENSIMRNDTRNISLSREMIFTIVIVFLLSLAFIGFLSAVLLLRRKAEKRIKESLQRMHLALQGGNLGLWDWDLQTGRMYFSNRWVTMLGYDPKDVQYSYEFWENLVHPEDLGRVLKVLKEHLEGNTLFYEAEHRLKKIDGSWCWVLARGEVLERTADGTPIRAVGTHMDVTDRILQEKALIAAKSQAEESDKLKSAFLANMSHEIRTPMNGIIGFAELMVEPEMSLDNAQEFARIILSSGRQLLTIVNDILDISRIETGQIDIVIKEFSLNPILDELLVFFQGQMEFKNLEYTLDNKIPYGKDRIVSDREKVIRIITNFIGNALKFTEDGYVKVGAYTLPDEIIIYVEDSGSGIPLESRESIFERFHQAHNTGEQSINGTGLGLAISKAYAEMIGAVIELDSELGKGSVFRLIIPVE